jgi:hypothetical protein
MILTFSFGDPSHVAAHVTPELLSRVDHQRLEMRPLDRDDAELFVLESLKAHQIDGSRMILGETEVRAGLDVLARKAELSPRNVMKAFDAVLTEMDYRVHVGAAPVTRREVGQIVDDLTFDADAED